MVAELYEDGDKVTYKYDNNGGLLTQMTVGEHVLAFAYDASGTPMTVTLDGVTYYYLTNIQGDVVSIVDGNGTLVVHYSYDAWGNILYTEGSMANTLGTLNPLRYRSYVYDTEIGLYYLQSRYYSPKTGRFLNADAYVSTCQGFVGNNMFAYCLNNPVKYRDDSGEFTDGYLTPQQEDGIIAIYEWVTGEEHPAREIEEEKKQTNKLINGILVDSVKALWNAYDYGYRIQQEAQLRNSQALIEGAKEVYTSVKGSKLVPLAKATLGVANIVRGVGLLIAPVPTPADDLLGVRLIQFGLYNTIYNVVQLFTEEKT